MDLKFKKEGNYYVSEFKAPGDFNLHLERNGKGSLVLSQSGVEQGAYERFYSQNIEQGKTIFDRDFGALVYPKWIKVESSSEVVSASVNFNVGGGSGSGSGEASSIEYLDVSNLPEGLSITDLLTLASSVKYYDSGDNLTIGTFFINNQDVAYNGTSSILDKTVAIKVNWDELVYIGWKSYDILTLREFIEKDCGSDYFNDVPRITKEQFYSLE